MKSDLLRYTSMGTWLLWPVYLSPGRPAPMGWSSTFVLWNFPGSALFGLYKPRAPDFVGRVLNRIVFYNVPGLDVVLHVKFKLERVQQSDVYRELIQTYSPLLYRFHRVIQRCFWCSSLSVGLKHFELFGLLSASTVAVLAGDEMTLKYKESTAVPQVRQVKVSRSHWTAT